MIKEKEKTKFYGLDLNSGFSKRRKDLFIFSMLFLFVFTFTSITNGQELPPDAEPPPFKVLSDEEKEELESQTKIKKRTKLALEFMDARLLRAEEANSKNDFDEVFTELGGFHAIIDHTLKYLNRRNNDSRKILKNFKRLEIGLRKFLPRIELIRRDVPQRYQYYVKSLIKNVRKARSKAIEPIYGDSVVREDDGK